ncbi:MAG: VCBS domain-containing protein, partial [Pseudorhodoplanes sp.]
MLQTGGEGESFQLVFDSADANSLPAGDAIVVPNAHLLFHADYKHVGNDLKLIGQDGETFVVHDYFKAEKRPSLMSSDGAVLTPNVVEALAGPLAPGQYAQAGAPQSGAQAIGRVAKAEGNATVIRNGVAITLNVGDAVLKGDVAQTGANSALGIVLIDGTTFSLTANARMVMNEFVYSEGGANNSALINLVQGSITFIAGQVAKSGDMKVETPVVTMGIRGTYVHAEIDVNLGTSKLSVLVEPSGVTGSFNLINKVTGQVIGTVSQAGIGWVVSPVAPGQVNAQPVQLTPAEMQQALSIVQDVFNIQQIGQQILQQSPVDQNQDQQKTESTHPTGTQFLPSDTTFVVTNNGGAPTTTVVNFPTNPNPPADTPPIQPTNGTDTAPPDTTSPGATQPNHAPVAQPDTAQGPQDGTSEVTGDVLPNDTDPDPNDAIRVIGVVAVSEMLHGTLVMKPDGTYTYTLNENGHALSEGEAAQDVFTYTISDSHGATATATLTINIVGSNDAPVATADFDHVRAAGDGSLGDPLATGNVLGNDTDIDHGAKLKVVGVKSGTAEGDVSGGVNAIITGKFGILILLSNGGYLYTLNNFDPDTRKLGAGQTGLDTFTYTIQDEYGATSTATLTVSVQGTNDVPTITGRATSGTVTENGLDASEQPRGVASVDGTLGVSDIDTGDSAQWSLVARSGQSQTDAQTVQGAYGHLTVDQNGHWVYTLDDDLAATQALSL